MTIDLHKWTFADREALMALCNAIDRTFLSDRLPYPYTEADAEWWLGMVAGSDGKEGVWRAIVVDEQIVGSISVERLANVQRNAGSIGYMVLTPFWSQGIGTEAVRQICGIAFQELALERIIGEVFPENLASAHWRWSASSVRCSLRTWHRPGCWRRMASGWRRRRSGLL